LRKWDVEAMSRIDVSRTFIGLLSRVVATLVARGEVPVSSTVKDLVA
jgi:hypothetical protein